VSKTRTPPVRSFGANRKGIHCDIDGIFVDRLCTAVHNAAAAPSSVVPAGAIITMPMDNTYQGNSVIIKPLEAGRSATAESVADLGASGAWVVFLSSTIGDLEEFRQEVKDVLHTRARIACFLSEEWINTYGATVETCKQRLEEANGFIGIFGYWYGSIPNGYKQSITHLEFTWALKKWASDKPPPIAILMPKSPSDAEKELTASAAKLIPDGKAKQKKHAALLKAFHTEVTGDWKTVTWFRNVNELREQVIVIGLQWRLGRPLDAATGGVDVVEHAAPPRRVADEEWGLLGRADHIKVFEKILNLAAIYPEVPAIALLIHGNEDSGQRVFLRQLLTNKKLRIGRPIEIGRPQVEQYDLNALTQWAGESVGVLEKGTEVASPDELAELIHEELQHHQLGFILDQIYRLSGGVIAWYEEFWKPLYTRLVKLQKEKPSETQHRLVAIVVDYDDQSGLAAGMISTFTGAPIPDDYARMWLLPSLDDFDAVDIADWFDALDVPDDGRRAKLVNVALNKVKGKDDGTPLRVFDRLANTSLWTLGEKP
jgi:hypothetical protein